jgi:hypothetical protein
MKIIRQSRGQKKFQDGKLPKSLQKNIIFQNPGDPRTHIHPPLHAQMFSRQKIGDIQVPPLP